MTESRQYGHKNLIQIYCLILHLQVEICGSLINLKEAKN